MTAPSTKLWFKWRAWYVPREERAFEGWLEGRPTEARRAAAIARTRQQRAEWRPGAQAWDQLIQLQSFVGQRVRIQFWDPRTMYALAEDEWPHPVEAQCDGAVTLIDEGHLQAFLLLLDPVEVKTGGCSGLSHLVERSAVNRQLAPVADLFEIETVAAAV
jgi:hypothetical protein